MKRKLLLVLSSLLLIAPITISCGTSHKDDDVINPEGPSNPNDKDPEVKPDDKDPVDPNPGDKDPVDPNPDPKPEPDPEPTLPTIKTVTLKEANELCTKVGTSYKEKFDENVSVKINGEVLTDYAISGNYHFMILADDTGILPILVNASKGTTGKYLVGHSYEVEGVVGSYRNTNCVKVDKNPVRKDGEVEFTKFAQESTIAKVYDDAYALEVEENDASILPVLNKIKATYVEKINNNLMLVFDGTKHIILHGDNYSNNGMQIGSVYDFYVMPSVHQGKRGGELIKAQITTQKDETYLDAMKNAAVSKTVTELSKTNRYDDKKAVYPFIIKVNAYVKANVINGKYHMAFVDDMDVNVKYDQVNKNPKTIYAKNHVLEEYELEYSNLTQYYLSEPATKGDFYFVVTDYQSSYHVFQAYVLDDLTADFVIQN